MTNEEILANAPGWATMVCMERFWQKLTANSWRSIRLDLTYESLRIMPSANSGGIRSLSDIRRIVELEKEVKKWQKWHSETSQTLSEVCGKAEAAERELENERMMSMKRFVETGRADRYAIEQKMSILSAVEITFNAHENGGEPISFYGAFLIVKEHLRQQLNGGE